MVELLFYSECRKHFYFAVLVELYKLFCIVQRSLPTNTCKVNNSLLKYLNGKGLENRMDSSYLQSLVGMRESITSMQELLCRKLGQKSWAGCLGSEFKEKVFLGQTLERSLKWNTEAESSGIRKRVFCASMADVFEIRKELNPWRSKLWELILRTQNLDWLILTKRPQSILKVIPWSNSNWPENVWIGTTVENQNWASKRLPFLAKTNAKIKFLSCEPLLGKIELTPWLEDNEIDWVIAGGESGHSSRPMSPDWVRHLRDQCLQHCIPFHFKQWGHWAPIELLTEEQKKTVTIDQTVLGAAGKAKTGRSLDGRTWDQFPKSA